MFRAGGGPAGRATAGGEFGVACAWQAASGARNIIRLWNIVGFSFVDADRRTQGVLKA